MPETKKTKQCLICSGNGLIKTGVKICQKCNGNKCIRCGINQSGYDSFGYDECNHCYGSGVVKL